MCYRFEQHTTMLGQDMSTDFLMNSCHKRCSLALSTRAKKIEGTRICVVSLRTDVKIGRHRTFIAFIHKKSKNVLILAYGVPNQPNSLVMSLRTADRKQGQAYLYRNYPVEPFTALGRLDGRIVSSKRPNKNTSSRL